MEEHKPFGTQRKYDMAKAVINSLQKELEGLKAEQENQETTDHFVADAIHFESL